jgi:predicted ATPase/DNA-binding SARP family transcriptional activator
MALVPTYSSAAPGIRVYLFGSFTLEAGHRPIRLPTRKVEALLAYLVLYPQPHSREKLADLFWGDTRDEQARHSLRTAIHTLRRLVDADLFRVDKTTVQLNPHFPLWVDVRELEEGVRRAQRSEDSSRAVLALYRGDLLAGSYDDWVLSARDRYRALYLDAALQSVQQLRAQGEYAAAIALAEQVLAIDPTNERAYQHCLFCWVALGKRDVALRLYRALERTLREELGVDPAPETQALLQRIQQTATSGSPSAARITNLPVPLSSFIGREEETAYLKALLLQNRLLTLAGVGGSGKTRLAIQVATDLIDDFDDGVWWVELAALTDGSLIPNGIAKVLGIQERPGASLTQTLADELRAKRLLLVLDNCEHLVDACAQLVVAIVHQCPRVTILTTSREALNITGERVHLVPTLAVPAPHSHSPWESWLSYDAVRLFVDRASDAHASFALTQEWAHAVAQICQRLDGIPLAIELAAARARTLALPELAARLDDRFSLLSGGSRAALPRHQTLRATLDWSYDLLSDAERTLLRRLAVFAGRFNLPAVERVCGPLPSPAAYLLARLVDKSLVVVEYQADACRYRLLETIRHYAQAQLASAGEQPRLVDAHLAYFTQLLESLETALYNAQQAGVLDQLEQAHDDLRAALRRAIDQGNSAAALRICGAMGEFWEVRGFWSEGRRWLDQALAMEHSAEIAGRPSPVQAWAAKSLWHAGVLAWRQYNNDQATSLLEQSLALHRALRNTSEIDNVLSTLAGIAFEQGAYQVALGLYREVLAQRRTMGITHRIGDALFGVGLVSYHLGAYADAQRALRESLDLLRDSGHTLGLSYPLNALGNLANLQGEYAAAQAFYEQCITLRRELGYKRGVAATLSDLASLRVKQGAYAAARPLCTESLGLLRELASQRSLACTLSVVACLAHAEGRHLLALQLIGGITALLTKLYARLDEPEHSDMLRATAELRAQLDSATFAAAWEQGSRLNLEELLALAQTIL